MENFTVFAHPDFDDHEQVVFISERMSGLKAIIAIHDTKLGPSLGGCRVWRYDNENEALWDVLRLSYGMSYKAAISNLALGGGKAVILADPKTKKTPEMMQAFGQAVEQLAGRYITAKDVGTSVKDMDIIAGATRHVVGLSSGEGDPSPYTALGVFLAIKATVKRRFNSDLNGVTVSVKGLGNVGYDLCDRLHKVGAKLIVSDIREDIVQKAKDAFEAQSASVDDIIYADADVFAPCAMGADLSHETIPKIKAKIICGGANNQLKEQSDDELLIKNSITYCPDYLVNAGGLISVSRIPLSMNEEQVLAKINEIPSTLNQIFDLAEEQSEATGHVADQIAMQKMGRA